MPSRIREIIVIYSSFVILNEQATKFFEIRVPVVAGPPV